MISNVRRNWSGIRRRVKKASDEKRMPASSSWPVAAYVTIDTTEDSTGNENAIALLNALMIRRVRRKLLGRSKRRSVREKNHKHTPFPCSDTQRSVSYTVSESVLVMWRKRREIGHTSHAKYLIIRMLPKTSCRVLIRFSVHTMLRFLYCGSLSRRFTT